MAEDNSQTNRLEIASAIVLSIAALASSWAAYQASLWDGEQAAHYSRANALHVEASNVSLEGDAMAGVEINVFGAWLDAKARGDERLTAFYEARFPPGLKIAFNDWIGQKPLINPAAAPSPFAMPSYRRLNHAKAQALDQEADKVYGEGQRANAVSDAFQQSATILSVALFFGGIGQVFKLPSARIFLLAAAILALAGGLLRLMSLPIQVLGLAPPS